jgi:hypothetical protein
MSDVEPRFLPFVRHDQYGKMGQARQGFLESIRLAIAALTVVPVKVVGTLFCIVGFYLICRLFQLAPRSYSNVWVPRFGKVFTRACLACIGFSRVAWIKVPRAPWDKGTGQSSAVTAGIVSNHCSWTDILVHMSRYFPSFVARGGTEKLPMIGPVRCGSSWSSWNKHSVKVCNQSWSAHHAGSDTLVFDITATQSVIRKCCVLVALQPAHGLPVCGERGGWQQTAGTLPQYTVHKRFKVIAYSGKRICLAVAHVNSPAAGGG